MVKVNTADKNSKKVCLLNNVCYFEKLMDEKSYKNTTLTRVKISTNVIDL